MAFVSEQERNLKYNNEKENFNIGPGHYLPITIGKNFKQNPVPFESSSLKFSSISNNNPGPGAYYRDKSSEGLFKLKDSDKKVQYSKHDSDITTKEDLIDAQMKQTKLKFKVNYERLGFSVKEKRFKDDPSVYIFREDEGDDKNNKGKQTDNTPGAKFRNKKTCKLQRRKLGKNSNKIPSIPQKGSYGFDIGDVNHLVQRENPGNFIHFSGVNGDTVGPGSYNIDIPDEWHRTGTNWSKLREVRDKKPGKYSFSNFNESLVNYNINQHDYSNSTVDIRNLKDGSKVSLQKLIRQDLDHKAKRKLNLPKANNDKIFPGPGYYFNMKLNSAFRPLNPYENGVIFGSRKERFDKSEFDDEYLGSPGPGAYFNSKTKKNSALVNRNIKPTNSKKPFFSKTDRFSSTTQSATSFPGPGSYDSVSSIKSNHMSKTSTAFYAHQQRFIETNQEMKSKKGIPGPGAYLNPFSNTGASNTVEFNGRFVDIRKAKELSKKPPDPICKPSFSVKDFGASVGLYNADYSTSIEYQNLKKSYSQKSVVAFNSGCPRKKYQTIKNEIGPGSYFNQTTKEFNQKKAPFNTSSSRIPLNIPRNDINQYQPPKKHSFEENNSWHKKTFNIKYL